MIRDTKIGNIHCHRHSKTKVFERIRFLHQNWKTWSVPTFEVELPSKLLHIWWKTKYQPGFIQHFNFHKIEVGILQNNNFRINHILNPWYLQLLRSYFHIGTIGNTVWYLFDDINDYINLWEIPHICRGCGEKLNDVETLQVEQKIDRKKAHFSEKKLYIGVENVFTN